MIRHKKKAILIMLVILLCLAGYIYNSHLQTIRAEDAHDQLEIKSAKEAINHLYATDKKDALANDLSKKKITNALQKVNQINDRTFKAALVKEVNNISYLFETQNMVKGLLKNGVIVDDVDEAEMNAMKNAVAKAKTIDKTIANHLNDEVGAINLQYNTIKVAREKVIALFTNTQATTVKNDVSKKQYQDATTMIHTIKNTKAKEKLIALLKKVNDHLTAKEETAKLQSVQKDKKEEQSVSTKENSPSTSIPKQSGFASFVASSSTAKKTDQIVTVVASGTNAQVILFEKTGGIWKEVIKTTGHVGSMGVGKASESVSRTPRGSYQLGFAFGTSNPGTKLPFRKITPKSYWISNVNDPQYNTWQERDSSNKADEHLADYPVQYQFAIVINYHNGVGGGSGFFLHCDNGRPTAGCVSVPTSVMVQFMKRIHSGAYIVNVTSQNEIANY